ncbi:MAG: phosphoenolpyruvate synthase [Bacteroidales bacterium]
MSDFIKFFDVINNENVAEVGGKNASLGEMYSRLEPIGIRIPGGFATTAGAWWHFVSENKLDKPLGDALEELDTKKFLNLKEVGSKCRKLIMDASLPGDLEKEIVEAYDILKEKEKEMSSVAVRSSATAEDLPHASFAGQHESYLNINGKKNVLEAVKKCYASLFTNRAIKYRVDNGFEHMKVALSAGVQRMIKAGDESAGVIFTLAPESGFDKVVYITSSWGLGENVVQGAVKSDEFYVFKPSLKEGRKAIISKKMGAKSKTMVFSGKQGETTRNEETPEKKRNRFTLTDDEINTLAAWAIKIEEHYQKPMDIEWAKDSDSKELFIVQARPETVHSSAKKKKKLKNYALVEKGELLSEGSGIGDKITSGKARILDSPEKSEKLKEGDVLITEITNPDWDPIMQKASAIITNSGGRTSHAAIVARELGAVAVVGTEDATEKIKDGETVTVSCAEGNTGKIYKGKLRWKEDEIDFSAMGETKTIPMLILGDPDLAFQYADYPVKGVGLMRLEFVINNAIKAHPLALVNFDKIEDAGVKKQIEELTIHFPDKEVYFTEKLSQAVATIAATFHPHDVIVRMSDFKSNEYANLLGGQQFEPSEENPMLGFRGASRYYHEKYREGFRLECEAMRIVRDDMGLTNVKLMIPFCRTIEEGRKVINEMEKYGLKQGWNDLEIYMMVEIPSNVIIMEEFAKIFDGFSIGSNDLTQLTLGLDRDSADVSELFSEKNEAVKHLISSAIKTANKLKKPIGLCGQAPSDFPDFAKFLVKEGINTISFNPDAIANGIKNIIEAEKR